MILDTYSLVAALADGRFHTGDELGEKFGVTRAAIWKALRKVGELDLELHSVRGKGYRLAEPLYLLDADLLRAGLSAANLSALAGLELLSITDSTNSHVLRRLQAGELQLKAGSTHVCFAEMQTAGKGRRGRTWVSPFGHNLYLTLLQTFDSGAASLDGLSLVAGLALVRALREWGIQGLGLKWPNDLWCQDRKLAGILIEISGDVSGTCQLVIGAGLNLRQNPVTMRNVEQAWTTLAEQGFRQQQRNGLFSAVLEHLLNALTGFREKGFAVFRDEFNACDVSAGRMVQVSGPGRAVSGIGCGVDASGAFLLDTGNGMQRFVAGEVSLKPLVSSNAL